MESNQWLIAAVSALFFIQALIHIVKPKVVERYALRQGYISAGQAVRLAGLFLLAGSLALWVESLRFYTALGLALFSFVAAVTLHKFWDEAEGDLQFQEWMNFLKNGVLIVVLIYIAIGLE